MAAAKNSLVANINRRKKKGTSRPKSKSTVSRASYQAMEEGWPKAAGKKSAKKSKKNKKSKKKVSKRG